MGDFLSSAADVGDEVVDFHTDAYDQVLQPLGLVKGDAEKALQSREEQLRGLKTPELRNLTAEDYRKYLVQQGKTELGKAPKTGRDAQVAALQQLQGIANEGGLTGADRARLEQIKREEQIAEKGQRDAIVQNAQSRGVGGSGLEMAQQLAAQQGGATRASARDLGVADLAQQRALAAIQGSANVGTTIRSGDYQKASAQDAINQFNADYRNRAGFATASNRQSVQETNRLDLPQRRYENERDRIMGVTGASIDKGNAADNRRTQSLQTVGSLVDPYNSTGLLPQGSKAFAGARMPTGGRF